MADRPMPPSHIINWSAALEAVEGDRTLLREVVEAYLEESPRLLSDLRTAIDHRDGPLLRRAAHTLKSSMRYFGAKTIFETAASLESMGKQGEFHNAAESLESLAAEEGRVVDELRSFVDQERRCD